LSRHFSVSCRTTQPQSSYRNEQGSLKTTIKISLSGRRFQFKTIRVEIREKQANSGNLITLERKKLIFFE
jgi:hypothetical protein